MESTTWLGNLGVSYANGIAFAFPTASIGGSIANVDCPCGHNNSALYERIEPFSLGSSVIIHAVYSAESVPLLTKLEPKLASVFHQRASHLGFKSARVRATVKALEEL